MWKTCIIAAAIILAAVIIGGSIQRAAIPDSVKVIEKLDADALLSVKEAENTAKRLANKNERDRFFKEILERIPNDDFSSLSLGEKVIYCLTKVFSSHHVLPLILTSLALIWLLNSYRKERGSMTKLLCAQVAPRVTVVVIGTVLLSYSISFSLALFSLVITALFYEVFSVTFAVALLLIVTSMVTLSGFALFDKVYNATKNNIESV